MKRLFSAVLVSGLLAVPSGASGQLLSSLCFNGWYFGELSRQLCFNSTTFSYTTTATGYSNYLQGYWSGYDRFFPPYPGIRYLWYVSVGGSGAGGFSEANSQTDPDALREYTWNSDASGALLGYDVPVPDISSFMFGNDQSDITVFNYDPVTHTADPGYYYSWEWCNQGYSTRSLSCELSVSVPEPSTYLLMLTGFLGLGFVAWRRKEEILA